MASAQSCTEQSVEPTGSRTLTPFSSEQISHPLSRAPSLQQRRRVQTSREQCTGDLWGDVGLARLRGDPKRWEAEDDCFASIGLAVERMPAQVPYQTGVSALRQRPSKTTNFSRPFVSTAPRYGPRFREDFGDSYDSESSSTVAENSHLGGSQRGALTQQLRDRRPTSPWRSLRDMFKRPVAPNLSDVSKPSQSASSRASSPSSSFALRSPISTAPTTPCSESESDFWGTTVAHLGSQSSSVDPRTPSPCAFRQPAPSFQRELGHPLFSNPPEQASVLGKGQTAS